MDEMQKLDGRLADQRQEKEELQEMLAAHQAEVNELVDANQEREQQYYQHNFEHLKNEHRIRCMKTMKDILETAVLPEEADLTRQEEQVSAETQSLYEIAQAFAPHHPAINNILESFGAHW